jgi:hypothetical protein
MTRMPILGMKPTHIKYLLAGFMLLGSTASSFAGCPHNKYGELDVAATAAAEVAGRAKGEERCPWLARLVDAEHRLLMHVEEYAVICVIDPEVRDVQARRLSKAMQFFASECGANGARE